MVSIDDLKIKKKLNKEKNKIMRNLISPKKSIYKPWYHEEPV